MSDFGTRLDDALRARVEATLAEEDRRLATAYPGTSLSRQPVHTVYVPADRFTAGTAADWGTRALAAWDEHGSSLLVSELTHCSNEVAEQVDARLRAKLAAEPVEDVRIDLEDGYGSPPDDVEDLAASAAGVALAEAVKAGTAPRVAGTRAKSLWPATRARGLRSLELFVAGLGGVAPEQFVVTLPKVTAVAHVSAFLPVLDRLESAYGLPPGTIRLELQIETPQAILGADGEMTVAKMLHAAVPRVIGLHYGTYDYSAALDVSAAQQRSDHAVADLAKGVMQVAAAQTGVRVVDGSSNVLPIGSRHDVVAAWRTHARLVTRALESGLYQGWDLHPAQLPTRYAATYAFFRTGLPAASARLRAFVDKVSGGVLDEPATMAMLAAFVVRGLDCGAIDEEEASSSTGLGRAGLVELTAPRGLRTPA